METPWRSLGSAHAGDQPAAAAGDVWGMGTGRGVRRGALRRAYVEEPRCSCLDFEEDMDLAALGDHWGRHWKPRSTSRLAFVVSKAADAAV